MGKFYLHYVWIGGNLSPLGKENMAFALEVFIGDLLAWLILSRGD